jgi:hypothetical protein
MAFEGDDGIVEQQRRRKVGMLRGVAEVAPDGADISDLSTAAVGGRLAERLIAG